MIDALPLWQKNFKALKPAATPEWAKNMANTVDSMTTNKAGLAGFGGTPPVFTFNKSVFQAILALAVPVPAAPAGAQQIASAYIAACQASTMKVSSGAYLGSPSPPTLFSVVASSLIDPPSILAGGAEIVQLLSTAVPVPDGAASMLPIALRAAFALLTVTVIGTNSVSPPAGPNPLTLPTIPVI